MPHITNVIDVKSRTTEACTLLPAMPTSREGPSSGIAIGGITTNMIEAIADKLQLRYGPLGYNQSSVLVDNPRGGCLGPTNDAVATNGNCHRNSICCTHKIARSFLCVFHHSVVPPSLQLARWCRFQLRSGSIFVLLACMKTGLYQ